MYNLGALPILRMTNTIANVSYKVTRKIKPQIFYVVMFKMKKTFNSIVGKLIHTPL